MDGYLRQVGRYVYVCIYIYTQGLLRIQTPRGPPLIRPLLVPRPYTYIHVVVRWKEGFQFWGEGTKFDSRGTMQERCGMRR